MNRNATESYVARSSLRLENTPPSHSHKLEYQAASADDRMPSQNRDNSRSWREGRAPRSPPQRSEPDASPATTRPPKAAAETRSAGLSCESWSSKSSRHQKMNQRVDSSANDRVTLSPTGC